MRTVGRWCNTCNTHTVQQVYDPQFYGYLCLTCKMVQFLGVPRKIHLR